MTPGLYAITTRDPVPYPVDFLAADLKGWRIQTSDLRYWQRHPRLYRWMERLYRAKHGMREDFDLTPVALTEIDIDRLETDIKAGRLAGPIGRLFRRADPQDLAFVTDARAAIEDGRTVIFVPWLGEPSWF